MQARTAFLTGGTGFVGGHVARALAAEGWKVRLLARDPKRAAGPLLEGVPKEVVAGRLEDEASLVAALSGVDAIVHVAGLTKARTFEEYREVNARGTERLVAAGRRAAPDAHFVLISTQAAAGPAREGRPVRDEDPARPISWYGRSKREGEEVVESGWRGPWTVLRPVVVYGPGDTGLFQYFKMAASGWIPVPAASTRIQLVGAERAGLAVVRSLGRSELFGKIRFLTDPAPITLRELAQIVSGHSGRRGRLIRVPDGLVRVLGAAETALETVTRRSQPFNADKAREILAGDWLCDGSALAGLLELPEPVPMSEGIQAAWAWYRGAGWLPQGPAQGPVRPPGGAIL
jgi:nucleoside-diphosphate-sugar epimerase